MRVALYVRVSTEEQKIHGLSIEAQTEALKVWAEPYTIVGIYADEGISARKPPEKRPALQRMLRDVEAGKIDLIAFTKLDRFFRNVGAYYRVQDILEKHDVPWKAIHEDYETQTASGRLKVNIMLSVAQDEADRTSERIRAVMDMKRERGEALSGNCALGLKIENKKYVPSGDAEKVRTIFREYLNKRSVHALTCSSAKLIGVPLTTYGTKKMLRNHKYVEAGVIDEQTFRTVQSIMAQRSQRNSATGRVYLFSGLVFCKECQKRMSGHTAMKNGKSYKYYLCYNHLSANRCNNNKSTHESAIESMLLRSIVDKVTEYNISISKRSKKIDIGAVKTKMDRLTDLYMNDLISREKYEADFRFYQEMIRKAEEEPKEINVPEILTVAASYQRLDIQHRKAFWGRIIKRIEIDGNGNIFYEVGLL